MKKKLIIVFMLAIVLTMITATSAYAADAIISSGGTYDIADTAYGNGSTLTVQTSAPVTFTQSNASTALTDFQIICSASNATITVNGINIDNSAISNKCALSFTGGGNSLTVNGENTLISGEEEPGIKVTSGTALSINGNTSSILNATAGESGAGIGGGYNQISGIIQINSGTINATGDGGAGIGGGENCDGGTILITGGTINAIAIYAGAGIGGGYNGDGGSIYISGGTVTATADYDGAGIGGGRSGDSGTISITGGNITAIGGSWNGGAGIGTGAYSIYNTNVSSGNITISGDSTIINSTGKYGGSGIGGGPLSTGGTIEINGGTIITQGDSGIGGGNDCDGGQITISDGDITTTGELGAGIGGGENGDGGNITITGGNITASGSSCGAGIGGGDDGNSGIINISGGIINATGVNQAAGIGGGRYGDSDSISISGGIITAIGAIGAAGIGGGFDANSGTTLISNGIVFACGDNTSNACDIGYGYGNSGGNLNISGNASVFLKNNLSSTITTSTHTLHNEENLSGEKAYGYTLPDTWTSGTAYAYLTTAAYTVTYEHGPNANFNVGDPTTESVYGHAHPENPPTVLIDTGYTFSGWTDGIITSNNLNDFYITANTTLTADVIPIPVTGVDIDLHDETLVLGDATTSNNTVQLTAIVSPSDAANKNLNWTSSDETVATVNSSGLVTAVATGSCIITATTEDRGFIDTCDITVEQRVTGVALSSNSETLILGDVSVLNDEVQLTAIVAPNDADNKWITWKSSDISVVTVSSTGLAAAVKAGTAIVTVTTDDGSFIDTCSIKVEQRVTGVSLDITGATLILDDADTTNDTVQLTETVSPSDADIKDVSWSSSDEAVATVDSAGLVTAVAAGSADITVTTDDGGFIAVCSVTVNQSVTGVVLNYSEMTMEVGDTAQINCTVEPADTTDKTTSWSSDNTPVASVAKDTDEQGTVTANAVGVAYITVTTNNGGYTDICKVTVIDMTEYAVNSYGGLTGNLFQNDGTTGIENWNVTLYSTPISVTTNANGSFGYSNVQYSNHTIVFTDNLGAEFDRYILVFSISASNGYSVSGDIITLNYTANTTNVDFEFAMNAAGTEALLSDIVFTERQAANPRTDTKGLRMPIVLIIDLLLLFVSIALGFVYIKNAGKS